MLAYKRILRPVDFSEFSRGALAFAGSIAGRYRSRLSLQHVVEVQNKIEAGFAAAGRLPTTRGGKILLCTDLSDPTRRAFDDSCLRPGDQAKPRI